MPATTGVGSREERRKERRRLCLELSKCGSSGPQSLYQCHSSTFSSHLSAQRLLFHPLRAGKTLTPSPRIVQHNNQPFLPPTYPAHAISSLNIALCLNALFFFFHCSAPSYLQKCRVLKNCHTSFRLHILFLSVHLTSGLGCKYRTVSGCLEDFLERVWGFYTQNKTLEFYLENRLSLRGSLFVKNNILLTQIIEVYDVQQQQFSYDAVFSCLDLFPNEQGSTCKSSPCNMVLFLYQLILN